MKKIISEELEVEILRLYKSGEKNLSEIARRLNERPQTVRNVLCRYGLARPKRGPRPFVGPDSQDEIVRLYEAGDSCEAIATRMGLPWGTVKRTLKEAGIELRPAGFRHGPSHHDWKGGRTLTQGGYVVVLIHPDDPFFCMAVKKMEGHSYVLEHRLVLARKFGRPLTEHETVHHIDGNKENNSIENLELRQGKHGKGVVHRCADCGSTNVVSSALS